MERTRELPSGEIVYFTNVKGTLKTIGEKTFNLKNEKKTPFRRATAEIEYPNGIKAIVDTRLYEASLEEHPDAFVPEQSVTLQVQTRGTYAGNSVVQLPNNTVDVSLLGFASTAVAEEEVEAEVEVEA